MKNNWTNLIVTLILPLNLFAAGETGSGSGTVGGGGGGKREPLFQDITENISKWIKSGNANQLEPILQEYGITISDYKRDMLGVISNYHITFTDDKVLVGNKEKTCRGYIDSKRVNQILCNNTQFGDDTPANINEIYRQVHHELAGLACRKEISQTICLEQNKLEDSDYRISNHISAFLRSQKVMRLPVLASEKFIFNGICIYSDNDVRPTAPNGQIVSSHVSVVNHETTNLLEGSREISLRAKLSVDGNQKRLVVIDSVGRVLFDKVSSLDSGTNYLDSFPIGLDKQMNMSLVCTPL